jgi:hypothetical protein
MPAFSFVFDYGTLGTNRAVAARLLRVWHTAPDSSHRANFRNAYGVFWDPNSIPDRVRDRSGRVQAAADKGRALDRPRGTLSTGRVSAWVLQWKTRPGFNPDGLCSAVMN